MTIRRPVLDPSRTGLDAAERLARATVCWATMFLLTGCLTMTRGIKQRVWVESQPPGATVTVDGKPAGVTPTRVKVTRGGRHAVTLVKDSVRADTVLKSHITPVFFAYILLFPLGLVPAGLDLITGAAHTVEDVSVAFQGRLVADSAIAAASVAAAPVVAAPVKKVLPVIDLPLKRNDRLRLATADGDPPVYMVVDSLDSTQIVGRALAEPGAARPDTSVVVVGKGDTRRVDVYLPPQRGAAGLAMTRSSALAFASFLAFPKGEMVALVAYPAAFGTGFALAEPRWSPREAHRVGSPLLANDSLRIRLTTGDTIRGRLLDVYREDLLLTSAGAHVRVPRADIDSVKRADGHNYFGAAILGAIGAYTIANVTCGRTRVCGHSTGRINAVKLTATLGGVLISPSFASRRWSVVERW